MSAVKRSISAPAELFDQADRRQADLGYSTFSDYIQALMRADALTGGSHLRESYGAPNASNADLRAGIERKALADLEEKYPPSKRKRRKTRQ